MTRDTFDLNMDILDRQMLDSAGVPCGNVDDLELDFVQGPDEPPIVTKILTSPGALGPRIGGLTGRIITGVWRWFHPERDPQPVSIDWKHVVIVDFAVHLSVHREEAGLSRGEDWVREHIIAKIPGAR